MPTFRSACLRGKIWFDPPPEVVAVQVCRVSGNLPVAGCKNAASISRLGEMTYKSMVYTEYFARGTEPQRTWSVHATQALPYPEPYFTVSSFDTMGEALNMEPRPEPPLEPRQEPPPAPNPASALPPPEAPEPPPQTP